MELVFRGMEVIFVWPTGADVPEWAWQIASDDNKAIECFGQFENALAISLGDE